MSIVDRSGEMKDKPYAFDAGCNRHKVSIMGHSVRVLSCEKGEGLKSVGTCSDGCCSDYECPDCGLEFRVEWPD